MKKIILITGASSGIGKETAKLLLAEGHKVYAMARRIEKMEDLYNLGAVVFQGDVTDPYDRLEIFNAILTDHGRIDVLINNAGYGSFGEFEKWDISVGRQMLETNVFALASMMQLVIPIMKENQLGTIINISSIVGEVALPKGSWYCASKFAVEGLTDSLRVDLKKDNIHLVSVQPGGINTEFMDVASAVAKEHSPESTGASLNMVQKFSQKHPNLLSKPIVVARKIQKLVNATNPPAYCRPTLDAKILYLFKRIFGLRIIYFFMRFFS